MVDKKDKTNIHNYGIETLSVHSGASPDPNTGSRATPIHQTTSFVFEDVDHAASLFNLETFGNIYTRLTNPTVAVLEQRIAGLEKGSAAVCASSGHSAQLMAFHVLMEPGDHFIAAQQLYGGSLNQFGYSFKKFDWNVTYVNANDPDNFRHALSPKTKLIFVESLANPGGVVVDIEAIAKVAGDAGIPLVVDNTLATPFLWRPFEWGANLVVHSLTKFLGGHGNSLGGVIVEAGNFDWARDNRYTTLTEENESYHGLKFFETFGNMAYSVAVRAIALRDLGTTLSPMNAFLILTGIETLPLRMARHSENARVVAEFLENESKVKWVSYAGLTSSPYNALAQKYLPDGAGAVFTFGLKAGYEGAIKFVENLNLFSHLANVGDTRSLIIHPASTTHRQLNEQQLLAAGAGPDVIRLSVGIESVKDILHDLKKSLAVI